MERFRFIKKISGDKKQTSLEIARRNKPILGRIVALALSLVLALGIQGCGKRQEESTKSFRDDISTQEAAQAAIEELGEAYWPDMDIPQEVLESQYGLAPELYEEYFGQSPMISVNVDTLLIVKAKEGQEEKVQEALEAFRDYNINEALQYPMNLGKVQAAKVETYGRYVCFVQLGGDTESAIAQGDGGEEEQEAAVIAHCQKENDRALEKIKTALTKED